MLFNHIQLEIIQNAMYFYIHDSNHSSQQLKHLSKKLYKDVQYLPNIPKHYSKPELKAIKKVITYSNAHLNDFLSTCIADSSHMDKGIKTFILQNLHIIIQKLKKC